MNTKLLYVLVSSVNDLYLEQAYVSMYSAKKYMPDCHVVLLVDKNTYDGFVGIREKEVSLADEIIVVDLDTKLSSQKRSRILKTGARNYIEGDYLFIDADTIIVRDLSCVDSFNFPIGACRDTHSNFQENPYRDLGIRDARALGIDISSEQEYFNSGVIYVKDIPETHAFYAEWEKNYCAGYEKGVTMDQPSFALTNIRLKYPIKKIPDIWNCELKHGIKYLKNAYIVHYLCTNVSSGNDRQLFLLNDAAVMQDIKRTGIIPEKIKSVILDPFEGIADTTHCFAGNDLDFFRTKTFDYFLKLYKRKGTIKAMDDLIVVGSKLKLLFHNILRRN